MAACNTFTFQCLLTSKLADFRSRCRMGGWHMCRYSMPLAASRAMLMRLTQSNCCCSACRVTYTCHVNSMVDSVIRNLNSD